MPDDLYGRDTLMWSEQQAGLLRRLAAGELVNDAVDWANVIEEVHDVGMSELRACQSLLQLAMTHLLKLHAWPESQSARHWSNEVGTFLDDAGRRFTPSMPQRIDLADLYSSALRRARTTTDEMGAQRPLPDACPFEVEALVAGDLTALLGTLDRS